MLASLAREGRFGRALPPEDQVFVVVADSVMKQLDGLKVGAVDVLWDVGLRELSMQSR